MKRRLILILAAVMAFSFQGTAASDSDKAVRNKEKRKITLFANPDRKTLLRQRDSLMEANQLLHMQIDSLYMINESLSLEGVTTDGADSINPGFIEMTGLDQFAATDTVPVSVDSLLSLWYQRRNLNLMELEPSSCPPIYPTRYTWRDSRG